MKILTLNHEFPPVGGGASTITLELCEALVEQGHTVDVVTMHFGDLPRHEIVGGVGVYRTSAWRRRPDISGVLELATFFPGAVRQALRMCRQNRYDIIHCHFLVPDGPLAWYLGRRTGIPYVVTCHGSDVPGYNPNRFKLAHKLIMPAWRFLVRRSPLVSPSESLRQLILLQMPTADVTVIPNGISAGRFAPAVKENRIVMASRIVERKGFQYAIQAMKNLPQGWAVDVVGDGDYLPQLKRVAAENNVPVTFHGWLDRSDAGLRGLFERSSIFIFPSEAENFPTVLLEAMGAGMAVITSNAGGCPEVVGDAAILVPPRDPGAIRAALDRLLGEPSLMTSLQAAGAARVRTFSWPGIASRYLEFYQQVIDNRTESRQ